MSFWSKIGDGFVSIGTTIGDTVADPFVQAYQATASGMENAERAVVDESVSFGNTVSNLGTVIGDGVVAAADTVGQGVVTFGDAAQKFSISSAGSVVDWSKTSALEVQSWTLGAAGTVSSFSQDAYGEARQGIMTAANTVISTAEQYGAFLLSLISSKLPKLGPYDSTARQIADIVLAGLASQVEKAARADGTTVGLDVKISAGPLSKRVGLYVDSTGQWGFYDMLSASLDSLGFQLGSLTSVSATVEMITVFGSRDSFSERPVLTFGATFKIGAFLSMGASIYLSPSGRFVGFRVLIGITTSFKALAGGGGGDTKQVGSMSLLYPKPNGSAVSMGLHELQQGLSGSAPNWDAATRAVQTPDQEQRIVTTAAAAALSPFKPRYYGALRTADASPLTIYEDLGTYLPSSAAGTQSLFSIRAGATPPAGAFTTMRLVSGLVDKNKVSIEVAIGGSIFYWTIPGSGEVTPIRFDMQNAYRSTFSLVPGLATGVQNGISLIDSEGNYLTTAGGTLRITSSVTGDAQQRAATFLIDQPQPLADVQQGSALNVGDVLNVGEIRRSGDGRSFFSLGANGSLFSANGTGNNDNRGVVWSTPATNPAGGCYATMLPTGCLAVFQGTDPSGGGAQLWTSAVNGAPGDCFAAVTNDGNLVIFQGGVDKPGELVWSSLHGASRWAKSRRARVAIKTSGGYYFTTPSAMGASDASIGAASKGISQAQIYQLETLFDGKLALRAPSMQYVGALNGGNSTVTATADRVGDWESFTPTYLPNGQVWLTTYGGQFLSADQGGGFRITADRAAASTWETFTIVDVPGDLGIADNTTDPNQPRSSRTVAIRTYDGHYWSAQDGGGSSLGAAAVNPVTWELFELQERWNGQVALRALNGQYVSTAGPTAALVVNQNSIGPTESFDRFTLSGGQVNLCAANGQFVCAEQGGGGVINANRAVAKTWETFNILSMRDAFGWERVDSFETLVLNSAPAAAACGSRLVVFFRGQDNALHQKTFDGTRWLPSASIGGNLTGGLCALSRPGSSMIHSFHRGTNGIYSCWNDGTNTDWHQWTSLGGNASCGPTASGWSGDVLDVFTVDNTGALIHTWWSNGGWTSWESLGAPSTLTLNAPVAATAWSTNNLQVVGRGSDNQLWARFNTNLHWGPYTWVDGTLLTSGPAMVSRGPGLLDVFARGADNGLVHYSYSNGAWQPWERLGGQLSSAPTAVVRNGAIDVFARGADNSLIHTVVKPA